MLPKFVISRRQQTAAGTQFVVIVLRAIVSDRNGMLLLLPPIGGVRAGGARSRGTRARYLIGASPPGIGKASVRALASRDMNGGIPLSADRPSPMRSK